MNRRCPTCRVNAIKVGRILTTGPPTCALCGTTYQPVRFANLPYAAAGLLAAVFLVAWLTNSINIGVFIVLCGLWLLLDFMWEYLVPLKSVADGDSDQPT